MSKKKTRVALEFKTEEQFMAALGVLDGLEGWTLPAVKGVLAVIVEEEDVPLFEAARVQFEKKSITRVGELPIEERQRIRGEMWPHMKARART